MAVAEHAGPAQGQTRQDPSMEGKTWTRSPIPSLGDTDIRLLLAEGRSIFLRGVTPGVSIIMQIRPHSRGFGQHALDWVDLKE